MSEADLIERLAEAIEKRIKPALPLSIALWDTEAIANYLQRAPRVVRAKIVGAPGFPAPIRLPNDEGVSSQPLWKASEVVAWAESHREKAMGRPRKEG